MPYFFTSESVSEGHPDKVADQISDALIDNFLAYDPSSKVACETLVTTGQVVLAGEVKSNAYLDVQKITRSVIAKIGYTKSEYMFDANSCGILSAIHEQSPDINQGVERKNPEDQGAGDQGMMFGFATNETENYMPLPLMLAHMLLEELAAMRREGTQIPYLRPDAKSQVTIQYSDDHKPMNIDTIVISTQHDDFEKASDSSDSAQLAADDTMLAKIKSDIIQLLIPRVKAKLPASQQALFTSEVKYHINPTGKFVIGGPHGDTGLTGRKIIVDTYGGKGAHGGGAFSGKDPSKVDRSAAYATRHIAKNMVAAGLCDQVLVQVSYAIGVAEPVGLFVDTYGTAKVALTDGAIADKIKSIAQLSLKPYHIEQRFALRTPIYLETEARSVSVKLFPWEELNAVDVLKKEFGI
jgi:S-adenosylmethionine synthetase